MSETLPIKPDAPILRLKQLARYFDVSPPLLNRLLERRGRVYLRAVEDVSLTIERGQTFALVGESGCGKSTVARLIVGLYGPTRGTIEFEGIDIGQLTRRQDRLPVQRRMQMIFQDPFASLNPRWRVVDIIAEPLRAYGIGQTRQQIRNQVGELLTQVGLSPADGSKYPHEFSGGQRQRISIARALASNPDFLVCDEPTSALDVSVQAQILNLMKELQTRMGLTYLLITHDLAVVYHMADRIGVMYLGRLCEVADAKTLFARPRHPYTGLLLETVPNLDMSGRERVPVAGEVPNPINPPPGCVFHPRCPHANERCRTEIPQPIADTDGGMVACHGVEEGRIDIATTHTTL